MNNITKFLSDNLDRSRVHMAGYHVTWRNQSLEVIQNGSGSSDSIAPGGFIPDGDAMTLLIPRNEFKTNELPSKGDLVTDWNGKEWLVQMINGGDVAVTMTLENRKRRSGAR